MNFKITSILLIAVMATSINAIGCAADCQKCILDKSGGPVCGVCYRSVLVNGSCLQGGPPKCDVAASNSYCFRCSERYLRDNDSGKCISSIGKIARCASGYIDGGVAYCDACVQSAPSIDATACSGSQQFTNCIWEGAQMCQRCRDGYSWDPNAKNCTLSGIIGCLTVPRPGKGCESCDVWSGWFMTAPGKCTKGTSIEEALKMIFQLF